MTAVIIRLGKNKSKDKSFLNVLSAIFSDTISVEEKLHICEENGAAITDKELLERIEDMASFGKAIADDYFEQGIEQGIEQGKIKGAIEKQNSLIKRMFEKNMTAEEIADITCLQIEEVQKILKNISK